MTITYVTENTTNRLSESVSALLKQGWQLHGTIVVDTDQEGTLYIQAMTCATPDLLSAMQGILDASFYGDSTGYYHVSSKAFNAARAAIQAVTESKS